MNNSLKRLKHLGHRFYFIFSMLDWLISSIMQKSTGIGLHELFMLSRDQEDREVALVFRSDNGRMRM